MSTFGLLADNTPIQTLDVPTRDMLPSPLSLPLPALELELVSLSLAQSPLFSSSSSPTQSFFSAPSSSSSINWSPLPSPSLSSLVPRPLFAPISPPPPCSCPTFRLAQPAVARKSLVFRRRNVYMNVYVPPAMQTNAPNKSASPSTAVQLAFRAQREAEDNAIMPPILLSPIPRMIFPFSPDYIPSFNPDLPNLSMTMQPLPLSASSTLVCSRSVSPISSPIPSSPTIHCSSSPSSPRPLLYDGPSIHFGHLPTRLSYSSDSSTFSASSAASSPFFDTTSATYSPLPSPRRYPVSPYPHRLSSPGVSRVVPQFIVGPDSDEQYSDEESDDEFWQW